MIHSEKTGEGKFFALLTAVSFYEDPEIPDLFSGCADLALMKTALTEGLRFPQENIRILGQDGFVSLRNFAASLKEFSGLINENDTLVLYFSGHGSSNELLFSDGALKLQSVADYLSDMPAGGKILILDACDSGNVRTPDPDTLNFETAIEDFAGKGIAVMASSAPDERSWPDSEGKASVYTEAVCAAMLSKRRIRKGRMSLFDINETTRENMAYYNRDHAGDGKRLISGEFRHLLSGAISGRICRICARTHILPGLSGR